MQPVLSHDSYGKSRVRVAKVTRHATHHTIRVFTVASELFGDFKAVYEKDDNRKCIATDTQKNIIYALAADHPCESAEAFACHIAQHYINTYAWVSAAKITVVEDLYERADDKATGDHKSAWRGGNCEKTVVVAHHKRGEREPTLVGGVRDLSVLRTAGSEFANFHDDNMRTLKDSKDRIFATFVEAKWRYNQTAGVSFTGVHARAKKAMMEQFANHYSVSVQATMWEMGKAVLAACPELEQIRLDCPNKHFIPFNLEPLGRKNTNSVFVVTDEPHGQISATITRQRSCL